jgi:hydroxyacylglutathione hydrolase
MLDFKVAVVPGTVFRQNCSLVWDGDTRRTAIIDPGGEPGRILDTLSSLDLKPEMLLLTHGHLDHAGGARALKGVLDQQRANRGESPVPLIGPDIRDRFLLEGIEDAARQFGITGLRNVLPDRWLQEGDVVELGSLRFEVLHCPGHTPGHVVFVERGVRFALVGDTVFQGSVGRTDFPYADQAALLDSIRTKLLPLGDDVAFVCGHGPGSTLGAERQTNPFLQG